MTGENVIPWEQIEPLIVPGMTGHDLAQAIMERVGLTLDRYYVTTENQDDHAVPLLTALRGGARILRRTELTTYGRDATNETLK